MVKILLGIEGVMIVKIFKNTILFVLCLVILSGCFTREGTIVGGKVHGSSDSVSGSISGDYRKFTGSATQDRKVKKGENWIFSFDDKTKQGTIIAYVVDSNDNTILEFNSGEGEKNIKVPKDDTYKVKIKTEEHGGEFRISWKKEK
ncbi:hypothetical protein PDN41_30070 [Bacillus cereus]|uniref:hypothetical protein n=1 Tax=Bacillus TaxID=1386 RepID=UPI001596ACAC|nr:MULTISPECIES: hypothetical protein [Bacillus cereus group]MBJ7952428.1 hypothetical protein [Bacillus cereus]MBT0791162.1 hypothetical protein [Bacillus cereus]MBZ4223514.1 hypothetical protein [Bacillus wiedmannii]MCU5024051.1 hypothetical protein [Bacillus cereus]MDA1973940.1 hypothetical protein [Bacillus cereus]